MAGIPSVPGIPGIPSIAGGGGSTPTPPLDTFVNGVLAITGATDTKLFWLAQTGDTTTSTTKDADARTVTWDGDVSSRLSAQGDGYLQSFNGTTNYGRVPDTVNLSFGSGPMSIIGLFNLTDTAATKYLIAKSNNAVGEIEWYLRTSSGEILRLAFTDLAGITINRVATPATSTATLHLLAASYSAASALSLAANDMVLSQDGVDVSSTATNNAAYAGMGRRTPPPPPADVIIGGQTSVGALNLPFSGSMGFVVVTAKILSLTNVADIKALANTYYGTAL